MQFNSHSFQFLLKHTLNIGQGTFLLKVRFSSKINHPDPPTVIPIQLHFFTDSRWQKAQNHEFCKEKTQHAIDYQVVPIPVKGGWSSQVELSLNQTKRPYIWYFFLTDCDKVLPQFTDRNNQIEIELSVLSPGGSHLSYEYEGKIFLNFIILLGYLLVIVSVRRKGFGFRLFSSGDPEDLFSKSPMYFLVISMGFEVLALVFETVHIIQMENDGVGLYLCVFFYLLCSVISQFILILLCFLLASGWSLTRKKVEDLEMYIPLFSVVLLFDIIILAMDRALFDNNYALHDYEGLGMTFILGIRAILWINLMFLVAKMMIEVRDTGGNAMMERFLTYFGFLITFFVLGLPVIVVLTNWWVPDYFKHKLIGIFNVSLQFITHAGFLLMFNDRDSLYNKVSIKKKSLQNLPVWLKNE